MCRELTLHGSVCKDRPKPEADCGQTHFAEPLHALTVNRGAGGVRGLAANVISPSKLPQPVRSDAVIA